MRPSASGAALLLVVLLGSGNGWAQAPQTDAVPLRASAEQQTEAVRRALLEQALKGPVRVVSHAWIDAEGRLHENAQFTGDTTVRGVRVGSYLNGGEEPTAEVDAVEASEPASCHERAVPWRRPALVRTALGDGFATPERALVQGLLAELGARLHNERGHANTWVAREAGWRPVNHYEAMLVGAAARQADWELEVGLSPARERPGLAPPTASARAALSRWGVLPAQMPWAMRLSLRWTDRHDSQRQHLWAADVLVQAESAQRDGAQALALARAALQAQLQQWLVQLDEVLVCEPVVAAVDSAGESLWLQLGSDSGIRLGDRVLLMERTQVPQRVLEPSALRGLGMAQVAQLDSGQARLQWLGGPRPSGQPSWVAVPLQLAPRL